MRWDGVVVGIHIPGLYLYLCEGWKGEGGSQERVFIGMYCRDAAGY